MKVRSVPTTALFLAGALVLTGGVITGEPARADACPSFELIGARGSGEDLGLDTTDTADYHTGNYGMGQEVSRAFDELSGSLSSLGYSTKRFGAHYKAIPITDLEGSLLVLGYDFGKYKSSEQGGVDSIVSEVTGSHSTCPSTRFILSGYSQGAHAVGDAISKLSTTLRSSIAG